MEVKVGQIVKMKKAHPCKSREWEILWIGSDYRMRCMGCDHEILLPRRTAESRIVAVRNKE